MTTAEQRIEHEALKRDHAALLVEQHRLEEKRPIDLAEHEVHAARLREHKARLQQHRDSQDRHAPS